MDKSTAELMDSLYASKNHEETEKIYKEMAEKFDKMQAELNYVGGKRGVMKCLEVGEVPKTARILDIGAGTGIIGVMLRSMGYENVDALDGCQELLEKAKEKNCYRNMFCSFVTPDAELPLEKKAYDVAVLAGVVCPAHILPTAFPQVMKVVKKGGLISWDMMTGGNEVFPKEISQMFHEENFEKIINSYVNDGLWELVGKYKIDFAKDPAKKLDHEGICHVMRVLE